MSALQKEARHYWRLATDLARARAGADPTAIFEALDELDAFSLCAETPRLADRAARDVARAGFGTAQPA